MSDLMLIGVLRMPPDMWHGDPMDVHQRHQRYEQAADRIESDYARISSLEKEVKSLTEKLNKLVLAGGYIHDALLARVEARTYIQRDIDDNFKLQDWEELVREEQ